MKKLTENQITNIYTKIVLGENKSIILIDTTSNKQASQHECNANIYCVDNSHHILWQVDNEKGTYDRDPFTYVKLTDNGKLDAARFFGKKYQINIFNGHADETGWEK